jgi:RNA polymerase sigma-70 factor (ECF subfamily)
MSTSSRNGNLPLLSENVLSASRKQADWQAAPRVLSLHRPPVDLDTPTTASDCQLNIAALLREARGGNRHHIGDLLQHYRNYLMLLATTQVERRLQPRVSPSDIVQETMLKAHRHFAQFHGHSERELLAWLRQILISNLATFVEQHMLAARRDVRREISIERFSAFLDQSTAQFAAVLRASDETPSVQAQHREEAVVLADRLAELPSQYREVLILRNIQGLTFEEAASRLDRSLGATRMLWLRAIEKLRVVYRKAGP